VAFPPGSGLQLTSKNYPFDRRIIENPASHLAGFLSLFDAFSSREPVPTSLKNAVLFV
jgi:hypothetical protein